MDKQVSLDYFAKMVEDSYDIDSMQYNLHQDDIIRGVEMSEGSYVNGHYLPLIFKSHLPLFNEEAIQFTLLKLYNACGQPFQKGCTGLARMDGGRMSSSKSREIIDCMLDWHLIADFYDKPKEFIEMLGRIDGASDLKLSHRLMRASHTRHALMNSPDKCSAVNRDVLEGNEYLLQQFVLNDTKENADLMLVDAACSSFFNHAELFSDRAHSPNNKNMSVVFMNFKVGTGTGHVIFFDEHDFKNWLYFHRHILRRAIPDNVDLVSENTIGFAATLLEAIDSMPNYNEFSPLALVISALSHDSISFICESNKFHNKMKLCGSTMHFIKRFINSGD